MTASFHKLTAGSGYDYLTRQVAVQDSTEKGHASLTSYYTEKGEVPGRWVGTGLVALEVAAGSAVSETQMQCLFGAGYHPDMEARMAALPVGASREQIRDAARIGAPFKLYTAASAFQQEVAIRCSQWAANNGLGADGTVPVEVRAGIRNQLATAGFEARMGRPPNSVELSSEVARLSRNPTTACAGFDVTFTPVKSVSALWGVAPPAMAAAIEEAHNAAVTDALTYLEQRVLYSRRGANGVRQVEVTGLIGAAFTHRDSRAGDPNLHTHVAIANKVRTLDGAWLAIDGRPLYAGMVSVSEVYNTALEAHLTNTLGVRFAAVPQRDPAKRSVREIIGVPAQLREAWSSRRAAIEARQAELAVDFQRDHHRPPTPAEAIALAQQATLETRQAKHEPRSLAEQRATWHTQAQAVLGPHGITRTLKEVTRHNAPASTDVTQEWITRTAVEMVERMAASRASWTVWHLHAEASRRAREHATTPHHATQLTALLLEAATGECIALDGWIDPISDPTVLRRSDGQSVYTTVGSRRYTSAAVIAAEQLITDAATHVDGRAVSETDVSLALLASAANGVNLTAGQVGLVREMATSGRRVQLALAAAGSGKTTALAVLASAWSDSGGTVLGLAPSAVAARLLADHIGRSTTLAKVAWDLHHHPGQVESLIGPGTLVVVDEAGMADTPALATVVEYAMERGASVRLIGDDQQLAAVGAGGVLRDINHTHGAVRLTEILRFTDPAEAAATLALRDGRPEALGFYLDHDRLHPGTDETTLRDALAAWQTDLAAGLDTIMLAGTRDHVTTLNQWARTHRLTTTTQDADQALSVELVDGNQASVGDRIITRLNDRRLALTPTEWVKNGDRFTITAIHPGGAIRAVHHGTGHHIHLPAAYVSQHVELGYAVTVHAAQGITVDTTHTVFTGQESRQLLYVAMSRGRRANHAYIDIVDGSGENAPIHPTTLRPTTAVDVLETILARDGSSRSATTQARDTGDPATRLTQAVARYTDALSFAAEHANPAAATDLDEHADELVDQLTSSPAWPTLRAHLLLTTTPNTTPLQLLRAAVQGRELDTAADPAAVLTWRLPTPTTPGPLPWLPRVPEHLAQHPDWGPYLAARGTQVSAFADELRHTTSTITRPVWALPGQPLTPSLVGDVEVWRAACGIDPGDRRPTGPIQLGAATRGWQQRLQDRLRPAQPITIWTDLLTDIRADLATDPYTPVLAHHLSALHHSGVPVTEHLAAAVADGPLPSEHPAAALWWRLARHLATGDEAETIPAWESRMVARFGYEAAAELEASPWWPHLAAAITDATHHGIPLADLLVPVADVSGFDDACQAMMWRTHRLTTPAPDEEVEEPPHPDQLPPDGMDDIDWTTRTLDLAAATRLRDTTDPDFTDLELRQAFAAADRWADSPHTPARLAQVTHAANHYFETQLAGSWSQNYFTQRFGQDLTGDPRFQLGHAPAGWTTLTSALRKQGFTTPELLAAGVATTTRTGHVIDRFRNRAMIPIHHDGVIVGFVGRRHPDAADQQGPKYLNSPATALFAKRDILYGHHLLDQNTVPVLAEGPMDAIAVTLAGHGTHIGVAPLGTALTPEQTLLLRGGPAPLLAFDADNAGHTAAENAYWLLAQHRHDPYRVHLPEGSDPAQHLHNHGPDALRHALLTATPQALAMVRERTTFLDPQQAAREIAEITAARPATIWHETLHHIPEDQTRYVIGRINAWTTTPAVETGREQTRAMRQRREQSVEQRWLPWANKTNPRLLSDPDWPQLAQRLDQFHHGAVDTAALAQQLKGAPCTVIMATCAGDTTITDWRPWATAVNPELINHPRWATARAHLADLQTAGADLDALARGLTGRMTEHVLAALAHRLLQQATQTTPPPQITVRRQSRAPGTIALRRSPRPPGM